MNIVEIEDKLNSVKVNSTYLRVSPDHPLELYLGLNAQGQKTLRFNGSFVPTKITGNNALNIKQIKTQKEHSILFSFNPNGADDVSIFYKLCEDIINHTDNSNPDDGYRDIVNRYNQWRKMFYGKKNFLAETEIQGLVAELLFLKDDIISQYGPTNGLNCWTGPEPTKKDFSYADKWFEIKSVLGSKSSVTISSVEQLESADESEGKLVVFRLEKMSPRFTGYTLNSLTKEIGDMLEIETDKALFEEKLLQAGYTNDEVYDNYVYSVSEISKYRIEKKFPRLRKANLPLGICGVKYDIDLALIESYKEK